MQVAPFWHKHGARVVVVVVVLVVVVEVVVVVVGALIGWIFLFYDPYSYIVNLITSK